MAVQDRTIVQPSSRVFTQWTPPLLQSAFAAAEAGHVRSAADLCDGMLADSRIGSAFETRVGGLLGLPLSFDASSGDGRKRKKAVKALEAGEDWWAAFPEPELKQLIIWGLMFGASFGQLHPTDHDGRYVPRLEFWHPRNTRYDWPSRQWMAKIEGAARETPITPGDGQWIVYAPYGNYRPWASGIWRGLSRWWLLKSFAQDDSGRRSEQSGTTVIEATEDSAHELRKQLASDLAQAARDAVVVLPNGFKLSMLSSKETIKENQAVIVELADTAISIAILGQNLTTEIKGGSLAAAQVHAKVEVQRIRADAETASTVLHDQALEWWAEFNFGQRNLAPWPCWDTDPPTDQNERAGVLKTLGEALTSFSALGYEIDPEQIEEDFGVKLKKLAPPPPPKPAIAPTATEEPPPAEGEEPPAEPAQRSLGTQHRAARNGAEDGSDYADRVERKLRRHAAKELAPTLASMLSAVEQAEDYDEAFRLVSEHYADLAPPNRLRQLTEAALMMAQLAGRHAVNEDTPELAPE